MATAFWRYGVLAGVLALPPTIRLSVQFAKLQSEGSWSVIDTGELRWREIQNLLKQNCADRFKP
jgi:hypothetical protein